MLDKAQHDTLAVGDQIETFPLIPHLTPTDVIVLRVVERDGPVVTYIATWLGITLGRMTSSVEDSGRISWKFI